MNERIAKFRIKSRGYLKLCKRALFFCSLIKEFDRILKDEEKNNPPDVNKQLNDKKQFMVGTVVTSSLVYLM